MSWFSFDKQFQSKPEYNITFFPIFSELGPSELKLIESKVRLVELKKGEIVYKQGETANAFYLILMGRLKILRERGEVISHLHPGDYFGETSILANRNHSATVEAQNDSIVLKIDKNDFLALLKEIPSLSLHISRTLGHRLEKNLSESSLAGEAKIISFYHQRPGVGNSTLSVCIANFLVQETKKKVLLLHLSVSSESRQVVEETKAFALSEFDLLKESRLDNFIVKNRTPFHVLKILGTEANADTEKKLAHLLAFFIAHYEYVLIDLPFETSLLVRKAIHQSDAIYFLVPEEEKDTEKTNAAVKEFRSSFGFNEDQIRLILREKGDREFSRVIAEDIQEKSFLVFALLPKAPELEGQSPYALKRFVELNQSNHNERYAKTVRFLAREISGRAVGIALGSGAAFGYAHAGVLKVLEEEGIEVDLISASSIGAVIGGMWAAGISSSRLIEILKTLTPHSTFFRLFGFADLSPAHRGFFKGEQVVRFLREYIGDSTFRDLRTPIKIIATDLATGLPVLFQEGLLLDAIRASISIPGVFRPFLWRGRHLIDGGVSDPLPVQTLSRFGAKKIIAVNVLQSPEDHLTRLEIIQKKRRKASELIRTKDILSRIFYEHQRKVLNKQSANIFNVLMKTIQFMEYGMAETASKQADITLNPVVSDAHWAEFFASEKFVRSGEEETRRHLDEIKKLISED